MKEQLVKAVAKRRPDCPKEREGHGKQDDGTGDSEVPCWTEIGEVGNHGKSSGKNHDAAHGKKNSPPPDSQAQQERGEKVEEWKIVKQVAHLPPAAIRSVVGFLAVRV